MNGESFSYAACNTRANTLVTCTRARASAIPMRQRNKKKEKRKRLFHTHTTHVLYYCGAPVVLFARIADKRRTNLMRIVVRFFRLIFFFGSSSSLASPHCHRRRHRHYCNQDQESFLSMKSKCVCFFGRCRFGDVTESVFDE